jgi:hypothetical protein
VLPTVDDPAAGEALESHFFHPAASKRSVFRTTRLVFVTSLHFALFALILKPATGGDTAATTLFGVVSFLLLVAGLVYEWSVDADGSA